MKKNLGIVTRAFGIAAALTFVPLAYSSANGPVGGVQAAEACASGGCCSGRGLCQIGEEVYENYNPRSLWDIILGCDRIM